MSKNIPAFPAPTPEMVALFTSRQTLAAIKAYRAVTVEMADGSIAGPTLRQCHDALRFEAEFGMGFATALCEEVAADGTVTRNFRIVEPAPAG